MKVKSALIFTISIEFLLSKRRNYPDLSSWLGSGVKECQSIFGNCGQHYRARKTRSSFFYPCHSNTQLIQVLSVSLKWTEANILWFIYVLKAVKKLPREHKDRDSIFLTYSDLYLFISYLKHTCKVFISLEQLWTVQKLFRSKMH